MLYWLAKFLLTPVCYVLFWPKTTGREHMPKAGPAIIFGNHLGIGESFLLPALVRPRMTFPVKGEIFGKGGPGKKLLAWFLRAIGMVPIDRGGGQGSQDGLSAMREVLESGGVLGIFPEGHRSPDGRLYKGRTGIARLALCTDALLIPLGNFGTNFTRRWLPWPWLYRPELRFGEPFRFSQEMRQAYHSAEDEDTIRDLLRTATDQAMRHVQAITGQEWVDEYSHRPAKTPGLPKSKTQRAQKD